LSYSEKKYTESVNKYLIRIFREGGHVLFLGFLEKYFKIDGRLDRYYNWLKEEKERDTKYSEKKMSDNNFIFSKKPERLKKKEKKGYLF